ncbi:MAG: hypothetical protein ACJA2Z_000090 [Candidatus Paceibacteria bacterium]
MLLRIYSLKNKNQPSLQKGWFLQRIVLLRVLAVAFITKINLPFEGKHMPKLAI